MCFHKAEMEKWVIFVLGMHKIKIEWNEQTYTQTFQDFIVCMSIPFTMNNNK